MVIGKGAVEKRNNKEKCGKGCQMCNEAKIIPQKPLYYLK